jgi:hypothetical protein|tara:strand:- start:200 stop:463 length:264 start_codon:yes stop_codon:yes gene_type:complete
MMTLLKDRLFVVLAVLLGLSLVSWLAASLLKLDLQVLGVAVLVLAFVKVHLIILYYMEVNRAHRPIRLAFETWVFAVAGILIAIYLL